MVRWFPDSPRLCRVVQKQPPGHQRPGGFRLSQALFTRYSASSALPLNQSATARVKTYSILLPVRRSLVVPDMPSIYSCEWLIKNWPVATTTTETGKMSGESLRGPRYSR